MFKVKEVSTDTPERESKFETLKGAVRFAHNRIKADKEEGRRTGKRREAHYFIVFDGKVCQDTGDKMVPSAMIKAEIMEDLEAVRHEIMLLRDRENDLSELHGAIG